MNHEKDIMFAPSILSADFAMLMQDIRKVRDAEYLHVDVMDGQFVPEITIGPAVLGAIREHLREENPGQRLDVHLMIIRPELQVDRFALAGADIITVHPETTHHLHRLITRIRDLDVMAGVALNPGTPLSALDEVVEELDLVLVMSVNPGYGGQQFIPQVLGKIARVSEMLRERNPHAILEVDGGINHRNIGAVVNAGAELIVAGSSVFVGDPGENLQRLRSAALGA